MFRLVRKNQQCPCPDPTLTWPISSPIASLLVPLPSLPGQFFLGGPPPHSSSSSHLTLVRTSPGHQLCLDNCDTYQNRLKSPCLLFQELCFLTNVPMSLQEPLGSPHQLMGWKLGNDIGLYIDSRPWVSPNVPQADLTTMATSLRSSWDHSEWLGLWVGGRPLDSLWPAPKPQAYHLPSPHDICKGPPRSHQCSQPSLNHIIASFRVIQSVSSL